MIQTQIMRTARKIHEKKTVDSLASRSSTGFAVVVRAWVIVKGHWLQPSQRKVTGVIRREGTEIEAGSDSLQASCEALNVPYVVERQCKENLQRIVTCFIAPHVLSVRMPTRV